MKVKIDNIKLNPYNTREEYGDLEGLKKSIEKYGLFSSFIVRHSETRGNYELAFGSRRLECLRQMRHKTVDVEVRRINDSDMATLAICENVHRKDLSPVELARAYRRGLDATNLSVHAFSKIIGEGDTKITAYLKILNLPEKVLEKAYGTTQLIALGKMQEQSRTARIMLENMLNEKDISSEFLKQIVDASGSVLASKLPLKTKNNLCSNIIFSDYSHLPPGRHGDIKTYAEALLNQALEKYDERLAKTAKALRKAKAARKKAIRNVHDIIDVNIKLDNITEMLKKTYSNIQKAIKGEYYVQASKRSRRKFSLAVDKIVSGLEKILKNGTRFGIENRETKSSNTS